MARCAPSFPTLIVISLRLVIRVPPFAGRKQIANHDEETDSHGNVRFHPFSRVFESGFGHVVGVFFEIGVGE